MNLLPSIPALFDSIEYVFLDRDGVINCKLPPHQYVTRPAQLVLAPDAGRAIARLNRAGLKVLVVTNQRGISLGLYSEDDLKQIHQHLCTLLTVDGAHLDGIYYCPHARDVCSCRKPGSGMFFQAFADFPGAHPANSLLVGDSLSDIQAGHLLGMQTVFIEGSIATQDPGANEARLLASSTDTSLASLVENSLPFHHYI